MSNYKLITEQGPPLVLPNNSVNQVNQEIIQPN